MKVKPVQRKYCDWDCRVGKMKIYVVFACLLAASQVSAYRTEIFENGLKTLVNIASAFFKFARGVFGVARYFKNKEHLKALVVVYKEIYTKLKIWLLDVVRSVKSEHRVYDRALETYSHTLTKIIRGRKGDFKELKLYIPAAARWIFSIIRVNIASILPIKILPTPTPEQIDSYLEVAEKYRYNFMLWAKKNVDGMKINPLFYQLVEKYTDALENTFEEIWEILGKYEGTVTPGPFKDILQWLQSPPEDVQMTLFYLMMSFAAMLKHIFSLPQL